MLKLICPDMMRPTTVGHFYSIDLNCVTCTLIYVPIKTSDGKEVMLPVQATEGIRAPRVSVVYRMPCLYVTHPSTTHDKGFSLSHAILEVDSRNFEESEELSESALDIHTSCLLPGSRKAIPGESYLVPLFCHEIKNPYRPVIQTVANKNIRLYSPEVDRYYEEILPTWEFPQPMSWDEFRKSVLEGKFSFNYPFVVPSASLYLDGYHMPVEVMTYIHNETLKRILR
ncbi:hypothetical protein JA33_255 [Dickeya phage vB_DsoM_JA33]|uniref:Uncharacterized protein n=2 Tax=Salmondvirus JA11 TaxID=2734141 RepID=A0A386K6X4_9CAUD|nr:hypothetical protein HOU32_gp254 [Dickeya phage vB_DsoM_JA11]AXG67629.1 hypothetical protein JA33_255 [Dickeya phage vB_DsoM_JA33]AYD80059.1 hypothetical protein JA11_254 [Dickeya phage vB_DsoM_JA11]